MTNICIFCFRPETDKRPWCSNAGKGCTYGFFHEYPAVEPPPKEKAEKKRSPQLCIKCNLHPKNPESQKNGCTHEYSSDER